MILSCNCKRGAFCDDCPEAKAHVVKDGDYMRCKCCGDPEAVCQWPDGYRKCMIDFGQDVVPIFIDAGPERGRRESVLSAGC